MSINEYHPYDDSELIEAGFTKVKAFDSGHVHGGVYRPPDHVENEPEQYRTYVGVGDPEAYSDEKLPPPQHCQHVEEITRQMIQYLFV